MTNPLSSAFRFRLLTRDDLAACVALVPTALRLPSAVTSNLVALWSRQLADGPPTFTVVEDLTRPHPDRIEAFGMSVFVSDAFVAEFRAAPRPYLAAIVYERMLARDGTVLDAQQIRQANSHAGLHLVVLHFGLRNPDMNHPRTAHALQIGSAAFFFCHAGFYFASMLNEVYGEQPRRFMEAGGFRLTCDFGAAGHPDTAQLAEDERPYLFELRREWVPPAAVSPLAQLFHQPRPIVYFTPSEQRILVRALLNDSDTEIAEALGISRDTVKKTWRAIFERSGRNAPFLMPSARPAAEGRRSQEKRRHLLEYLRTHLEELRPYEKQRVSPATR